MINLSGPSLNIEKNTCICFSASWNIYHDKIIKMIESIEKNNKSIDFIMVDIDTYDDLVKLYSITEIPTFVFSNKEKTLGKFSGMVLTKPFNSYCKKIFKEKNVKTSKK